MGTVRNAQRLALAIAALLALGGCAGPADGPAGDTPSAHAREPAGEPAAPDETPEQTPGPEPEPPTTAAEVRDQGSPQPRLAGLTVHLVPGVAQASVEGTLDGERWTITPGPGGPDGPDGPDGPVALFAAPEGTSFQLLADGSVVLPSAPGVTEGLGIAPLAAGTYALPTPDLLAIHPRPGAPSETLELWFGRRAVEEATWGDAEGGRSLAVVPTAWARAGGLAGAELAWWHLEWFAPGEATPGMRDQLVCHVVGAPDKASWNLEPWRPEVGLALTMLAECNPT